jgi:hypothetical protein
MQNSVEHFLGSGFEKKWAEHVFIEHVGMLFENLNFLNKRVIYHY